MARPLPITLVAGFLGAGKTSLLHHLISEHAGGHLAVLVESAGELNLDLRALRGLCGAMRRSFDVVEEFGSTDDLLEALNEIIRAARHERVLVEVSGLTQAAYWVRKLRESPAAGQVENVVVVVDLLDFHREFVASTAPGNGEAAVREFQREQIEGATILVLNKCDLAGDAERLAATRMLRTINAKARIIETDYGSVPPEEVFRHSASEVLHAANHENGKPAPLFESVVYRAFRPFHPQRFWYWFNAPHSGLYRAKGLVWLATRNLLVGGVSRAGLQNSCGAAGIWWAALPREEWPSDTERLMEMNETWREPYGDRRQELLLIGEQGRAADAARMLNLCLLTDDEMALPDWGALPDPFPAWDLEDGTE
jgi:G3E family GTPase